MRSLVVSAALLFTSCVLVPAGQPIRGHALRLKPGDDLRNEIVKFASARHLRAALKRMVNRLTKRRAA